MQHPWQVLARRPGSQGTQSAHPRSRRGPLLMVLKCIIYAINSYINTWRMNINSSGRSYYYQIPRALVNCWLQGYKSGITWKHTKDTIEMHRTSLPALHIHKTPIWQSKWTNQGRTPRILNKGPTRSAPAKDGPKLPQTGFHQTPGWAEPLLRRFRLIFGGKIILIL